MSNMKIATRAFVAEIGGESFDIAEGERIAPGHEIVAAYPDHFRTRGVEEELAIRSARIAELHDRDTRVSFTPQTEAGKREQREAQFWQGVKRMLDPGVPAADRAEQSVFAEGQALMEDIDSRQLADVNADAEREFGLDRDGWNRRMAG